MKNTSGRTAACAADAVAPGTGRYDPTVRVRSVKYVAATCITSSAVTRSIRPTRDSNAAGSSTTANAPSPMARRKTPSRLKMSWAFACFFTFASSSAPTGSRVNRSTSVRIRSSTVPTSPPVRTVAATRNRVGSALGVTEELTSVASRVSTSARYNRLSPSEQKASRVTRDALLRELRAVVGDAYVLVEKEDIIVYEQDGSILQVMPEIVVLPASP